jgi:flagellar biosynthesis/type III secretory pathway protein FliH
MDPAPLDRVELKLTCLRRIAAADLDDVRRLRLVDCVEAYLPLNSGERARYDAALAADGTNEEVRVMAMTWSERLEAKGVKKGLREGRREGKKEGLQEGQKRGLDLALRTMQQTLLGLLGQRFGELPESTRRQVEAISSLARLRRLTERVLVARSLAEMGIG